jgi:hypothetical protein
VLPEDSHINFEFNYKSFHKKRLVELSICFIANANKNSQIEVSKSCSLLKTPIHINGMELNFGRYICRLEVDGKIDNQKMVLIK